MYIIFEDDFFKNVKYAYVSVFVCVCVYIYIYVWCIQQVSRLLVQAFKIIIDSWNFNMLLLYNFWNDWPIFRISGSNEQLQQQLEYTLLKPDCHSSWIS